MEKMLERGIPLRKAIAMGAHEKAYSEGILYADKMKPHGRKDAKPKAKRRPKVRSSSGHGY